jgi:large subunit ribosomal protein L31
MKAEIHPTYHPSATVTCGCGTTFVVGGTQESYNVEICSKCHPYFTGEQKLIDTAGRVERFRSRQAAAPAEKKEKKVRAKKTEE